MAKMADLSDHVHHPNLDQPQRKSVREWSREPTSTSLQFL